MHAFGHCVKSCMVFWSYDETEVVTDLSFCIVMYIRVKWIIEKGRELGSMNPSLVDCMEADVNVSLQLIVRKLRGLSWLDD